MLPVSMHQSFEETGAFRLQDKKMEKSVSKETIVPIYQNTRRHILQVRNVKHSYNHK
jgi:hypothetical protein